jgi:hypothetical protein
MYCKDGEWVTRHKLLDYLGTSMFNGILRTIGGPVWKAIMDGSSTFVLAERINDILNTKPRNARRLCVYTKGPSIDATIAAAASPTTTSTKDLDLVAEAAIAVSIAHGRPPGGGGAASSPKSPPSDTGPLSGLNLVAEAAAQQDLETLYKLFVYPEECWKKKCPKGCACDVRIDDRGMRYFDGPDGFHARVLRAFTAAGHLTNHLKYYYFNYATNNPVDINSDDALRTYLCQTSDADYSDVIAESEDNNLDDDDGLAEVPATTTAADFKKKAKAYQANGALLSNRLLRAATSSSYSPTSPDYGASYSPTSPDYGGANGAFLSNRLLRAATSASYSSQTVQTDNGGDQRTGAAGGAPALQQVSTPREKFCGDCGQRRRGDAKFCTFCGKPH